MHQSESLVIPLMVSLQSEVHISHALLSRLTGVPGTLLPGAGALEVEGGQFEKFFTLFFREGVCRKHTADKPNRYT